MGLGQVLLLLAPVGIAERRLTPRRPLLVPLITSGFFLANIFFGAVLSVLCAVFKDKAFDVFPLFGELAWGQSAQDLIARKDFKIPAGAGTSGFDYVFGVITVVALLWLVWAL